MIVDASGDPQGQVTGLGGGLPIRIAGALVGGIGVGSGSPDQDIAAIGAKPQN